MNTVVHNPQLRLLNALRANAKPIMTFLGLPSFRAAQIVAQTGVDVSFQISYSQYKRSCQSRV
jgi:4-hydroxy-2-oxoheptanedioate aldolase